MTMRDFADKPFTTWGPAPQPRHVGAGASLVDEDQPVRGKLRLILRPHGPRGRNVRPVLLGRAKAFF